MNASKGFSDPLETPRLLLEPWSDDRLDDLIRLSSDARVMRFIGSGDPWERVRAEHMHRDVLNHWATHDFGWRAASLRDNGELVGFIGLNWCGPEAVEITEPSVEIGWWIEPDFWGQGCATEAAEVVRDEAFDRVGLDRIIGRHQAANPASGRIMQKLGMTFEREATGRHGDLVRIYGLDRNTWALLEADTERG